MATLIDTTPFEASGVCLTGTGQIVVCMRGQQERNHVAVYSPDGKTKMGEIKGRDTKGKQWITDPFRVVQNSQYCCIINFRENLVAIDQSGSQRWVYDGTQAKLSKYFSPHGVCTDHVQNVLVSDTDNQCVHYLETEGRLIQVILTERQIGLAYHWVIDVDDETGQVWVGNSSGDLVVAKYLK